MPPTLEEAGGVLLLNDAEAFQNATETLFKILQNLVQHPGEEVVDVAGERAVLQSADHPCIVKPLFIIEVRASGGGLRACQAELG